MAEGANEYVMGNISNAGLTTSYPYNYYDYYEGHAGTNFTYSTNTEKYLTTYAWGSTKSDQTAYNRGRLGDATGEVVLSNGGSSGWYNEYAYFPFSGYAWFNRNGIFGFFYFDGGEHTGYSTRAALSIAN